MAERVPKGPADPNQTFYDPEASIQGSSESGSDTERVQRPVFDRPQGVEGEDRPGELEADKAGDRQKLARIERELQRLQGFFGSTEEIQRIQQEVREGTEQPRLTRRQSRLQVEQRATAPVSPFEPAEPPGLTSTAEKVARSAGDTSPSETLSNLKPEFVTTLSERLKAILEASSQPVPTTMAEETFQDPNFDKKPENPSYHALTNKSMIGTEKYTVNLLVYVEHKNEAASFLVRRAATAYDVNQQYQRLKLLDVTSEAPKTGEVLSDVRRDEIVTIVRFIEQFLTQIQDLDSKILFMAIPSSHKIYRQYIKATLDTLEYELEKAQIFLVARKVNLARHLGPGVKIRVPDYLSPAAAATSAATTGPALPVLPAAPPVATAQHKADIFLGGAKLPPVDIPKWSGRALDFQRFINSFDHAFTTNPGISYFAKYQYLKACLPRSEQRTLLTYPNTENGFLEYLQDLKQRNGEDSELSLRWSTAAQAIPNLDNTAVANNSYKIMMNIKIFRERVEEAIRGYKMSTNIPLDEHTWYTFLVPKLIGAEKMHWQTYSQVQQMAKPTDWAKDVPRLDRLREYLQYRLTQARHDSDRDEIQNHWNQMRQGNSRPNGGNGNSNRGQARGQGQPKAGQPAQQQWETYATATSGGKRNFNNQQKSGVVVRIPDKCTFCSGPHPPATCRADKNPKKLWAQAYSANLCTSCCMNGHTARSCPTRRMCGLTNANGEKCQQHHARVLHHGIFLTRDAWMKQNNNGKPPQRPGNNNNNYSNKPK